LSQACVPFFDRVAADEIAALTSTVAVMEVIHRAILLEAIEKLGLERREAVQHLKQHPELVKALKDHHSVPSRIYQLGISIEAVTHIHVHESRWARDAFGLMANDSLVVAFMRKQKVYHLVTNDSDFKRVTDIQVWMPR
jgi:predicted nucleic acid-binding protein